MSGNGGTMQEMESRRMPEVLAGMEKSLERELNRAPSLVPAEQVLEVKRSNFAARPPLQTIADALKRLVWDDNEKLAQMIGSHFQANDQQTATMAAAIQRAADDLIEEDKDNGSRQ